MLHGKLVSIGPQIFIGSRLMGNIPVVESGSVENFKFSQILNVSNIFILFTLFTNPSARAGYDTRSIFKRSLTGLNSVFLLLD